MYTYIYINIYIYIYFALFVVHGSGNVSNVVPVSHGVGSANTSSLLLFRNSCSVQNQKLSDYIRYEVIP